MIAAVGLVVSVGIHLRSLLGRPRLGGFLFGDVCDLLFCPQNHTVAAEVPKRPSSPTRPRLL